MDRKRTIMKHINILLIVFIIFSCKTNHQIQKEAVLTNKIEKDRAKYSLEQQLILASFNLDFEMVNFLLKQQININARMGEHEDDLFMDKWELGYPMGSSNWTALLAVSSSNKLPPPFAKTVNTTEGREIAQKNKKLIQPNQIKERDILRLKITKALIKANANLDFDDGYGSTALAEAVYHNYEDMAIFLIKSGAKINTKTGVYIDGTGDIGPMHRGTRNSKILKEMIKHGGNISAQDDNGDTPLHWATLGRNLEGVKLLIKAGANVNAKNKEGYTPIRWANEIEYPVGISKKAKYDLDKNIKKLWPEQSEVKKIRALLISAGAEIEQQNNNDNEKNVTH